MNKIAIILIIFSSQITFADIHNCNGTLTDIPCAKDSSKKSSTSNKYNQPQKKRNFVSDGRTSETLSDNCIRSVKLRTQFKDPDSVKIEGGATSEEVEYYVNGKKNIKYVTYMMINAKNSYGAYAGAKPYICTHSGDLKVAHINP
jgi:hypothetical protein